MLLAILAAFVARAALAQGPGVIPAGRAAKNVAIIDITSDHIEWTDAVSIIRRIKLAETSGAEAIVFELDTKGGDLGACLEISEAIKNSGVSNTVAWVHDKARGAGSLIAIACRSIIMAPGSTLGGPARVRWNPFVPPFNIGSNSPSVLAIALGDLVESARKNAYDEKLVQGLAAPGVRLFMLDNPTTGQRLFADTPEYKLIFGLDPPDEKRSGPAIASSEAPDPTLASSDVRRSRRSRASTGAPTTRTNTPAQTNPALRFQPASTTIPASVARDIDLALSIPTQRPALTIADRNAWTNQGLAADGQGLLLISDSAGTKLGLSSATIADRDQLRTYFGADRVAQSSPRWYEYLAKWLSIPWIKVLLIVIFLVGLLVEFTHPGTVLPGAIASIALCLLFGPTILMGLSSWWEPVAVILGIILIALEVFVFPSFGIVGVIGLLMLLGGLVATFTNSGAGSLFPSATTDSSGLWIGLTFVSLSLLVAVGVMFALFRSIGNLPLVDRLVLKDPAHAEDAAPVAPVNSPIDDLAIGDVGTTITPLRPSGRAEFGGVVIDVVSEVGVIPVGASVRIVELSSFRIGVELASDEPRAT
jgi:membrane-bound ClpP family serine protease